MVCWFYISSFKRFSNILHLIFKKSNCSSLKELVDSSNYIFISVPTPMKKEGECDLAIIEKVISDIALCSNTRKTIIIKSTVPVGFTKIVQI